MIADYHADLQAFSLDALKQRLLAQPLFASHRVLIQNIDEQFAILQAHGIQNLADVFRQLKTKNSSAVCAKQTGIDEHYLTLLRREVNGYLPKPANFSDFPNLGEETIKSLQAMQIRHTADLFPFIRTAAKREAFSQRSGLSMETVLLLTHLTDLARIRWVGPAFSILLLRAGYDTVAKVIAADAQQVYHTLIQLNEKELVYGGKIGLADMRLLVQVANDVPLTIDFS
jgi:hypothetical protein